MTADDKKKRPRKRSQFGLRSPKRKPVDPAKVAAYLAMVKPT